MALPTQADVVTNPLASAQFATLYGPQTQQALRRSQYLADALKQQLTPQQNPRSGAEVAARLLATAILQRANDKGQDALIKAMQADQSDETARALAGLGGPPQASAGSFVSPSSLPPASAAGPLDPGMSAPAPTPGSVPAPAPLADAMSPDDRLAIARTVYGEARGEPAPGQQGVASVILNRAHETGQTPSQVVAAPHQFAGFNPQTQALTPDQLGPVMANIGGVLDGSTPDPTGGADHFFNPQLANPSWGEGPGQMIGQHKFVRLNDQRPVAGAQVAAAPPPTAAPQAPPQAQRYQVASNGPTPPPPSAPGSSPPAAGTPPAAPLPQASPAGGNSQPQWPTWKPSQAEYEYVQGLLMDPKTHAQGVQVAQQMRQKMTQPVEAQIQLINGVPFYVPKDPTAGAPTVAIPVPQAAMSQTLSAEQAGIAAPPGTSFNRDPLGNVKQVYQPQNGQQIMSAPGQGYREAPIAGGTNDPTAPAAKFSNEGKLRDDYAKEIAPYVQAREGYQKVIKAAKDGTPASDIALVFGYMKTLDPGSTVREGEQATVQNSGTIPQTISNMYNRLLTGNGRLAPEQRAQFAESARNQFGVYQNTFDAANQRYGALAQSYGMDPRNVIRSFDPIEPYRAPGSQQGGVPTAARSAFVNLYQQGKIDERKPFGDPAHPIIAVSPEVLQALDKPENRGKHVITPDGKLAVIE